MKSETLRRMDEKGINTLTEYEAKEVLREYNIPCPQEHLIEYNGNIKNRLKEFKAKDKGLNYPLYMKISSRDILHKTEANVIMKINSDEEILKKGKKILNNSENYNKDAEIQGILLSEDVSSREKRELFIGSVFDKQFGHVVSLGIGGISIEVYEDVEFRSTPLEQKDIYSMVEDLEGKKILQEFRGKPPVDIDSLTDTALKVSKILEENGDTIKEVDINPLLADSKNNFAVDALITLKTS